MSGRVNSIFAKLDLTDEQGVKRRVKRFCRSAAERGRAEGVVLPPPTPRRPDAHPGTVADQRVSVLVVDDQASARQAVVQSHFDYENQAVLYVPPDMPDPRSEAFAAKATEKIRRVLEITEGRAFCLFTSYAQMNDVF